MEKKKDMRFRLFGTAPSRNPTLTDMVGMHHRGFGLSNLSGARSRKECEDMSKFDYNYFYGDGDSLGFNASKYNKEEALKIGAEEYGCNVNDLTVEEAYIYYGFGTDEDGEARTTYWICDVPKGNSFKAWKVYKK
jgi:hypothetical protein